MSEQRIHSNFWAENIVDAKKNNELHRIESTQIISIITEAEKLKDGVFYRGESKNYIDKGVDTRLLPSVLRGASEKAEYYDALTNFPQEFSGLSNLSKLAKMQHYNYPTRLLDLTTNPLVALWFACSDYSRDRKKIVEKDREDGYFYVIATKKDNVLTCDSDKALLLSCLSKLDDEIEKRLLLKLLKYAVVDCPHAGESIKDVRIDNSFIEKLRATPLNNESFAFAKFIGEVNRERSAFANYRTKVTDLLSTYIIKPLVENERQRKQEGLFAIFGIQDHMYNNSDEFQIKRYLVPKDSKTIIIKQLDKLGINEATLFGDLESRASYNRYKEELARQEIDEAAKKLIKYRT